MKKLDFYIFKNISINFILFLIIISLVLTFGNAVKMYDILFSKGESIGSIISIFFYMNITLTLFTVPMAVTLAINFVYAQLSQNNEIISIKTAGLSLKRLYAPALLFTFFIFSIFLVDVLFLINAAQIQYSLGLINAFKNKVYIGLEEKNFYSGMKGLTIYVNNISPTHTIMNQVFFVQNDSVIYSKKAKLVNTKNGFIVKFYSPFLYQKTNGIISLGNFKSYSVFIKNSNKISPSYFKNDTLFMNFIELYNMYKQKHNLKALFAMNRMLVFSLSIFIVSLIGFIFGISLSRSGKSTSALLCISIFFLFYILEMFGESLYQSHHIIWGLWIPNIILFSLSIYLFYKKSLE